MSASIYQDLISYIIVISNYIILLIDFRSQIGWLSKEVFNFSIIITVDLYSAFL